MNNLCFADVFNGEVVAVSDGDTISVRHAGKIDKIRLNGIDCPERSQSFGGAATHFTLDQCLHAQVMVTTFGHDRYKRIVGDVQLPNGKLLNNELVRTGNAWWYKRYAPDNTVLQQLERTARRDHLGLWTQRNPVPPWTYRHGDSTEQPDTEAANAPKDVVPKLVSYSGAESEGAQGKPSNVSSAAPITSSNAPRSKPLQGGVEELSSQKTLQGGVNDKASPLLQGRVKDAPPLQGRADQEQIPSATLYGLSPNPAAVMHITQFKLEKDKPRAPLPIGLGYPQVGPGAQERSRPLDASANMTQPPMRSEEPLAPPQRSDVREMPKRTTVLQPPSRDDARVPPAGLPTAASDRPPARHIVDVGAPMRVEAGGGPPVRVVMEAQPPPARPLLPPQVYNPVYSNPSMPVQHPAVSPTNNQLTPELRKPREEKKHEKEREIEVPQRPNVSRPGVTVPPPQLPSPQALTSEQESLLWDQWYARINQLVCTALTKTMPANGNPTGSNRVQVTVWPNHHIATKVLTSFDKKFDKAITDAYKLLDGDSLLAFPAGTHRTVMEYESAHSQAISAAPGGFDTKEVHGDVEIIK